VKLVCAVALTVGTTLGGWRIIRTVGRGIYRIHAVDGLASQTTSADVILGASVVGAPVSTTQVVASSVIGVGVGRRRWHHVRCPRVPPASIRTITSYRPRRGSSAVLGGSYDGCSVPAQASDVWLRRLTCLASIRRWTALESGV
jgi:phosphate/sulfate permease